MFKFKQFQIHQERCAMKVGTDGVLLGAWSRATEGNVLDIGTGTGLIALMLAQRTQTALIDAIEIDVSSAEQAKENVADSPWNDRVSIQCKSVQEFAEGRTELYDLIVSNPPFFNNAYKAPDTSRNTARHTDELPPQDLIQISSQLLKDNGLLSLILPVEEGRQIIDMAKDNGLHLHRICKVHAKPDYPEKRWLMELGKTPVEKPLETKLIIEEGGRHQYSDAYIDLTKDFYLNF